MYFREVFIDSTERKRTEEALRKAHDELELRVQERTAELSRANQELQAKEARFRTIIERNADGMIIVDSLGVMRFVNPAAEHLFGRCAEELLGESFGFPVVAGETTELDVIRQDGKPGMVEMRVVEIEWEGCRASLATFRDITERAYAEARRMTRFAVTSILARASTLAETIPGVLQAICEYARWELGEMWLVDPDSHLLRRGGTWSTTPLNPGEQETVGYTMTFDPSRGLHGGVWATGQPAVIDDVTASANFPHASLAVRRGLRSAIAFPILNGRDVTGILIFFSRLIHEPDADLTNLMNDIGNQIGQFIARKWAEEELRSAHRALKTLSECNQALIRATDESVFLHDICRIIVKVGGYRLAWAGLSGKDEGGASTPTLAVRVGYFEDQYIETTDRTCGSVGQGYGPISTALRTRLPCVARNVLTDPAYTSWRSEALRCGYASSVTLPLVAERQTFGVLTIYAAEADAFGKQEVTLLMEMASDLVYGILSLRTRAERDRAEEALRLYAERLTNMRAIDQAILTAQTPEAIARAALGYIQRLVRYQWASMVGSDLETRQPVVLVTDVQNNQDGELSFAPSGVRLPESISIMPGGMEPGAFHYVEDILAVPERSKVVEQLLAAGIRSYVSVPLLADGQLIGGINLGATMPRAFDEQNLSIVREVADQLAVAIHHALLFEQVRAGRERLQVLSRRLMEVQEVERRHIARELHDEIGQSLTAVKISLQSIRHGYARGQGYRTNGAEEAEGAGGAGGFSGSSSSSAPSPMGQQIKESIAIVDHALQQVRNLSLDLRPSLLDDLGLVAALRWYVDRQSQWSGVLAEVGADPDITRLPSDLETACFRVAQEALTNVVRHARARHAHVDLRQRGKDLSLVIRDDGIGFDVRAAWKRAERGASLGLIGMQERVLLVGGQLDIISTATRGTEIRARFPIRSMVRCCGAVMPVTSDEWQVASGK
ncbi:MAG: GAF domain-containing protein [Chloroflexaceae bacterium]|nr:GAF domain-containing protein [Chloroflexaceae bacterium]